MAIYIIPTYPNSKLREKQNQYDPDVPSLEYI